MSKLFKRLSAAVVAMTMAAVCSASASAYSVKATNSKKTSGGSNGTITLRTDVYADVYEPQGSGISVYYYGAKAYVVGSSSIKTKMSLIGTYYTTTSSINFSLNSDLSKSENELIDSRNSGLSNAYTSLSTTTKSNDTAFGSCSYSTNGNF